MHLTMHLFVAATLMVVVVESWLQTPSCQDCVHFVNRRCRLFGLVNDPDKPPSVLAEMEFASQCRKNPDQCGARGDFFQEDTFPVWKKNMYTVPFLCNTH